MKILANDGISLAGKEKLEASGFEVLETKVAQEQLANFINENDVTGILVRSATQVRKELIDSCASLKLIGRGGVGMDNIDVAYAREKGLHVINTPSASSQSVAELVFAHIFTGARFLQDANRNMPLDGDTKFKQLKKSYAKGTELRGKTLGIIGFGRIGKAVAKMAIGLGMKVMVHNRTDKEFSLPIDFYDGQSLTFTLKATTFENVLENSDFITIHIPKQEKYLFTAKEYGWMKPGVGIVNASRGGIIDEEALLDALEQGQVGFAGLDVFENEPSPHIKVLMQSNISLSPHIGGSTTEAQERIGTELAEQIINLLG